MTNPISVSDARSNPNDQIAHAGNALRRSSRRRAVFAAVYSGKRKAKTVSAIMEITGLSRVAVLQAGGKLAGLHIVNQVKVDGETAYEKDRFFATNKTKILRLALNPEKLKEVPTKYAPKASGAGGALRISIQGLRIQVFRVTCDDFQQLEKVKRVKPGETQAISEKALKAGVQKLLGETGVFQDWGGEKNDLYTSKITHKGKRRAIAFAFKGPGTRGILTPRKLGKNANQIQRLFLSPADIFVIQYHGQVHEDVIEQMHAFAVLNSVREAKRVWYGVIDGDDTSRIMLAYAQAFAFK